MIELFIINLATLVAVGGLWGLESEKYEDGNWSDIQEPPIDASQMAYYDVIFHDGSHYYIGGEYERESTSVDFKTMYGNDAEFVDVTSVMSVSKTMNKKFLEK